MYINASSLMTGLKRIFKNTIAPHDTVAAWEQLFWCVVWDAQSASLVVITTSFTP